MTNEDFEHLKQLIAQSHRLLFAGRVTGKLQMLRDISLETVLLLDAIERPKPKGDAT